MIFEGPVVFSTPIRMGVNSWTASHLAAEQAVMTELRPISSIFSMNMPLRRSKNRLDHQECPFWHAAAKALKTTKQCLELESFHTANAAGQRLERLRAAICITTAGTSKQSPVVCAFRIMLRAASQALPISSEAMQALILTASGRILHSCMCFSKAVANVHSVSLPSVALMAIV